MGSIVSTEQIRPAGPSIDSRDRALKLMRGLSSKDFGNPGLHFRDDGALLPIERPAPEPHHLLPLVIGTD